MQAERKEWVIGVNERYETEIRVDTSVSTAERGGAKKVLSFEAEVKPLGAELLDKEAEVSGKVNYRLLYLDGQDRLCGLDYFKDFKCKITGDAIAAGGSSEVSYVVPDAEARIEGDEVMLSATLGVSLRYFGEDRKQGIASLSEAECKMGDLVTQRVNKSERTVETEKSAEVGTGVKKVLLFSVDPFVTAVTPMGEETEVSGEARANVVYVNDADETAELTLSLPFAERFEGGADASYHVYVKNARVVLAEEEEGNSLDVEVTLVIEALTYESKAEPVVLTACGEKNAVIEKPEVLESILFKGQGIFAESLRGEIPLEAAGAYLCFVRPGCRAIAEVEVQDGAVTAEGVAAFQVVYLTEEGRESVQAELPFSFRFPFAQAKTGQEAEVRLTVGDAKASYNGKSVSVEARVSAEVMLYERGRSLYLADAEEGDVIPESEAGISVYFAEKGEDVWRIAKAMNVLPSALIKANPFLEEPLTEDKKVLIFRKK